MGNETMKLIVYKCVSCKSADSCRYYPNEPVSEVISCWNCGAGRGMTTEAMMLNTVGMFIVNKLHEA